MVETLFRIRRIHDDVLNVNKKVVARVQEILRQQFPQAPKREIRSLPRKLANPLKYRFRTVLFAAEDVPGNPVGCAILLHEPELRFSFLDFISAAVGKTGRGFGGALYERVRREVREYGDAGIFMECLPDDPALSPDPAIRRQNVARLRFYERYGARPIDGTDYETPVEPDETDPPFLVFDPLGSDEGLPRDLARAAVRAILERKYPRYCPPDYVDKVVSSFGDDPVRLRPPRYLRESPPIPVSAEIPADRRILLAVNDRHDIHHVHERGYVESPARLRSILRSIEPTGLFERAVVRHFPERHILDVHSRAYYEYFKAMCGRLDPERRPVYPYVFPIRNVAKPPRDRAVRAGYYCIDTFTPLTHNAYLAAKRAVDCALTCAKALVEGRRLAYAAVRPPGHHAERSSFGGFCYFNSCAVAAHFLATTGHGPVAILDVDYHHGNGQQNIFYDRSDVLTVSIHGHPSFAYPYFSGFGDERGEGDGRGYNLNLPQQETLPEGAYRDALQRAIGRVRRHKPTFLVVALGLDTARGDPTGTWMLAPEDFEHAGARIGEIGVPTLVVQEGGYDTRVLGRNAARFLTGLWNGARGPSGGTRTALPHPSPARPPAHPRR